MKLPPPPSARGPAAAGKRPRISAGFTLIEVLAAVFLTSVVISVALAFFVNLSRSTEAAAATTQEARRAFAVLDRVARDLEGAYLLVKPPALDPLAHPWIFRAESSVSTEGADRIMFTSRNYRPRNPTAHGSDLGVVTYMLHANQAGDGYDLLRSITPGLPELFEREFPSVEDEGLMLVAEDLSLFGVRFLTAAGEWQDVWDSSLIEESSMLPRAAEIEVAFVKAREPDEGLALDDFSFADGGNEGDSERFLRRVAIPMRAVDLEAMLDEGKADQDAAAAEDEEDEYSEEDEEEEGDERIDPITGERLPSLEDDGTTGDPTLGGGVGSEFDVQDIQQ